MAKPKKPTTSQIDQSETGSVEIAYEVRISIPAPTRSAKAGVTPVFQGLYDSAPYPAIPLPPANLQLQVVAPQPGPAVQLSQTNISTGAAAFDQERQRAGYGRMNPVRPPYRFAPFITNMPIQAAVRSKIAAVFQARRAAVALDFSRPGPYSDMVGVVPALAKRSKESLEDTAIPRSPSVVPIDYPTDATFQLAGPLDADK